MLQYTDYKSRFGVPPPGSLEVRSAVCDLEEKLTILQAAHRSLGLGKALCIYKLYTNTYIMSCTPSEKAESKEVHIHNVMHTELESREQRAGARKTAMYICTMRELS